MRKFFSFNHNQTVIALTLVFVLLLGVLYFFIYVPNNQRVVEEQRFRCLQNIEKNIKAKRDNSVALLNTLLPDTLMLDTVSSNLINFKYIEQLGKDSKRNFLLLVPDTAIPKNKDKNENVLITLNSKDLSFYLIKGKYKIGMKYSVKQFFDPILPRDSYDEYIVFQKDNIVYQTFESGITEINKDSLSTKNSSFSREHVKNIFISGTQYKLFSQQLSLNDSTVITIAGLLNANKYQDKKNELPENIVIALFIISIATILAFPWIKLYQIGGKDRLTVTDGVLTFPVSMLLISVILFASFKFNAVRRPGKVATEDAGRNLTKGIEKAFSSEVLAAYNLLNTLDDIHVRNKTNNPENNYLVDTSSIPEKGRVEPFFKKWALDEVFWLDRTGQDVASWTNMSKNAPPANFSDREYFKHIVNDQPLFFDNDIAKQMYVEQVVSWTTGTFTTIISKKSMDTSQVAALSVNLKSLTNVILPAGISFCIINKQGNVLYHSNASKNLNENILNEFSETQQLKASIAAGTNVSFETKYLDKAYNIYARSMKSLPYHIIVFDDKAFSNNRDMNVSYFCFFMLSGFFLILIVELFIVFLAAFRKPYFKKHYFDVSWLGPNKAFHNQYNFTIVWNLINIILILIFYIFTPFLHLIFILLVSSSSIIFFLNSQYKKAYKGKDHEKHRLKRNACFCLVIIIVVLNGIDCLVTREFPLLLILFECLVLILAFSIRLFLEDAKKIKDFFSYIKWDFSHSFSVMIFLSLIITSGIPVGVFFNEAYNHELKLIARYKHKQLTDDILAQYSNYARDTLPENAYKDGTWIEEFKVLPSDSAKNFNSDNAAESERTSDLLDKFVGYHSGDLPKINEFFRNKTNDFTFISNHGVNTTLRWLPSEKFIKVRSVELIYNSPFRTKTGIINLLVLGIILLVFWAVLHRMLRKLFALDLPSQEGWKEIDQLLLTEPRLNSQLFIIGSPGSGKLDKYLDLINKRKIFIFKRNDNGEILDTDKLTRLRYFLQTGKISKPDHLRLVMTDDVHRVDLISIPEDQKTADTDVDWKKIQSDLFGKTHVLVVIDNFEYDIKNQATNRIKLDLLERLLKENKSPVIIISTIHPVNFLESLNKQEAVKEEGKRLPEQDLERWHVLLGHFRIVIEKLDMSDYKVDTGSHPWQKTLAEETRYSHFLTKMQRPVMERISNDTTLDHSKLDGDALVSKIGISAHYFYMYVWQTLTKEEKFLLYDLAEDGLVNPYDNYNLTLLISKGLIVRENNIMRLFNEGFRIFILTAIGNSEVLLLKDQIKDNGNWSKLKGPLMIMVVAVLAFLYASQQEAYSMLIKYMGIITLAVPTAFKLFDSVESMIKKEPATAAKKE